MNKLLKYLPAADKIFLAIPGVSILLFGLGVPPNSSKIIWGGIITALCAFTIQFLIGRKREIEMRNNTKIEKYSIIAVVLFIIFLIIYLFLYNLQVIKSGDSEPVFFPFWPQGKLKLGLTRFGSEYELIRIWGRDYVDKIIQSSSKTSLFFTSIIMLVTYIFTYITLTYAFVTISIKILFEEDKHNPLSSSHYHSAD